MYYEKNVIPQLLGYLKCSPFKKVVLNNVDNFNKIIH